MEIFPQNENGLREECLWDSAYKSSSCSSIAGEFLGGTEQTLSSNEASAGSVATLHAEVSVP